MVRISFRNLRSCEVMRCSHLSVFCTCRRCTWPNIGESHRVTGTGGDGSFATREVTPEREVNCNPSVQRRKTPGCMQTTNWDLVKIWGFDGGDYEECLLGYKTPVRTSQETHYVSATEPSRVMLCKIWGLHGADYEECRLLGYINPVRTSQETIRLR
jgi:hypothetical protein